MRKGRNSPRAGDLADELRRSIQEGYKTSTGAEQRFLGEKLDAMDTLDEDREARLINMRIRLPHVLWVALVVLGVSIIGLSYLVGMESDRLHLLTVRSEEHTSELQSRQYLVCRLLLEKKNIQHSGLHLTRCTVLPC